MSDNYPEFLTLCGIQVPLTNTYNGLGNSKTIELHYKLGHVKTIHIHIAKYHSNTWSITINYYGYELYSSEKSFEKIKENVEEKLYEYICLNNKINNWADRYKKIRLL